MDFSLWFNLIPPLLTHYKFPLRTEVSISPQITDFQPFNFGVLHACNGTNV